MREEPIHEQETWLKREGSNANIQNRGMVYRLWSILLKEQYYAPIKKNTWLIHLTIRRDV